MKGIANHYDPESCLSIPQLMLAMPLEFTKPDYFFYARKLSSLHTQMDNAALEAYGLTDIDQRHDFYEVDYPPEKDRVRFTIHPEASREVLNWLLELKHSTNDQDIFSVSIRE